MKTITLILFLGVASGAFAVKFDHDIKIKVYDDFRSLQFGLPLKYYVDSLSKSEEVRFTDDIFHYYPDNVTDFVIAYKDMSSEFLHGYYIRVDATKSFTSEQWKAVEPLHTYIQSGEFYVLTPLAAEKVAPDYYKAILKYFHYDYFSDVDLTKPTPLVFLIPKSYFKESSFEKLLMVAEFDIDKEGVYSVSEFKPPPRVARASHISTEVYGEPAEVITKVAKPVVYTSPEGFRLINTYRYDLPDFPITSTPYDYFFRRKYPYYYDSFSKAYGMHLPYYPFTDMEKLKDIRWSQLPLPVKDEKKIE